MGACGYGELVYMGSRVYVEIHFRQTDLCR